MDPPEEPRRSFPERRSGSSRRQALRKFSRAFRGWASSVRFRSGTGTTGIRASAPGVGSASSRATRATAGCVDQYSPPSRGSAISRRAAGHRLEAPAAREEELEIPPWAAVSARNVGSSPCGCDTAQARRSCNGLLRDQGRYPRQPYFRSYRSLQSCCFVPTPGAPRRLFRHADERDFVRGEGSSWRDRHHAGIRSRCQVVSAVFINKSVKYGKPLAEILIWDCGTGGLLSKNFKSD